MENIVINDFFNTHNFKKKKLGGKASFYMLDFKKEGRLIFLTYSDYFNKYIHQIMSNINFDLISKISYIARSKRSFSGINESNYRYSGDYLSYESYNRYISGTMYQSPVLEGDEEMRYYKLIFYIESELFPFYNKFVDPRALLGFFHDNNKLVKMGAFLNLILIIRKLSNHPLYMETWDLIDTWLKTINSSTFEAELELRNIYWDVMKEVKPIYDWKDEYLDPNTTYPGTIIK